MKFRKKPVEVEAVQWEGTGPSWAKIQSILGSKWKPGPMGSKTFYIETLEGDMLAMNGDWIIQGVAGEIYPCKPDIFEATYEAINSTPKQPQEDI